LRKSELQVEWVVPQPETPPGETQSRRGESIDASINEGHSAFNIKAEVMIFAAVMRTVLWYQHVEPLGFRRSTAVGFCLTYAELQERTFFGEASRVVDRIYQTMFWSRGRMGCITYTLASSESYVALEACEIDCNDIWPLCRWVGRKMI